MNEKDMKKDSLIAGIIDDIETNIKLEEKLLGKKINRDFIFLGGLYILMNHLSLGLLGLNVFTALTLVNVYKEAKELSIKNKHLSKLDNAYFYDGVDIIDELVNFDDVVASKIFNSKLISNLGAIGLLGAVISQIDSATIISSASLYSVYNCVGAALLHKVNVDCSKSKAAKEIALNKKCIIKDEISKVDNKVVDASYNVEIEKLNACKRGLEQRLDVLTYDRALEEIKREREEKGISKTKYIGD